MSDYLRDQTANMFKDENQWLAACQLSELLPDIKKKWFVEFMNLIPEQLYSLKKSDNQFQEFQIFPRKGGYCEGDNDLERCWYIFPFPENDQEIALNEQDLPMGLTIGIEASMCDTKDKRSNDKLEFFLDIGLVYYFTGTAPAMNKLDTIFNSKELKNIFEILKDKKEKWNSNGFIAWKCYYPPKIKGKNFSDDEAIWHLHTQGKEYIATILKDIIEVLTGDNKKALRDAHDHLVNRQF